MRTLAELQAECADLGLTVPANGRPARAPYLDALRRRRWERDHPGRPLPDDPAPMLLSDWHRLDPDDASAVEADLHAWLMQPKLDGVRALLHVEPGGVRITGRRASDVTHRPTEHGPNLPHLTGGWEGFDGTVIDGELVCPEAVLHTGRRVTADPLQAAVAVLATDPANASEIQRDDAAKLRFHAFDVLRVRGGDVTGLPLRDRLDRLAAVLRAANHPFATLVPHFAVGKAAVHHAVLSRGGEGTVWKRADMPYQPGRRVSHWLKRKREVRVEAFVTGCKPGTPGRGNADRVGAVEFGVREEDGTVRPVAWVSAWVDAERDALTVTGDDGTVTLNPAYLGRRAVLAGRDYSARARRLRHARLVRWLDDEHD